MRLAQLEEEPDRVLAVVFEPGEEVVRGLLELARERSLAGSRFTAIGAFQRVVLGYFDWKRKDYDRIEVNEQVEVLSLIGNLALGEQDEPKLHAHVVLGDREGRALGGHLLEGHVRPTLEVMLAEAPRHLRRRLDPTTGLALLDLPSG